MHPPSCLPHASALKATPVQRFPVGPGTRLSWRKRVVSCSPRCSQPWDMQLEKSPCQGGTNGAGNAGMQQSRQRGTRLLDGQKKSCRKSHKVPESSGEPSAEVSCTLVPPEVQLALHPHLQNERPCLQHPHPRSNAASCATSKERFPPAKLHKQVQQFGPCQSFQSYFKALCFPTLSPSTCICPPVLHFQASRQLSEG